MTRRRIEEPPPSYSSAFLRGTGARSNFLLQEAPRGSAEAAAGSSGLGSCSPPSFPFPRPQSPFNLLGLGTPKTSVHTSPLSALAPGNNFRGHAPSCFRCAAANPPGCSAGAAVVRVRVVVLAAAELETGEGRSAAAAGHAQALDLTERRRPAPGPLLRP